MSPLSRRLLRRLRFTPEPPPPPTSALQRWSSLATWGGSFPVANDAIVITGNRHILLDVDTPSLGSVTIEHGSSLTFESTGTIGITTTAMLVWGQLLIGTAAAKAANPWHITLTGIDPVWPAMSATPHINDNGTGMYRTVMAMSGGHVEIHSASPSVIWTRLNDHAAAAATALTTAVATGWASGDEIAISPTGYYTVSKRTEAKFLASNASGTSLALTTGLGYSRWGKLQYPIDAAPHVSLTQGTWTNKAYSDQPTVIDQRAVIANMTRNGKIRGINDTAYSTDGNGAHLMTMPGGYMFLDGVEIDFCGQEGRIGKYGLHYHMLSWTPGVWNGLVFVGGGLPTGVNIGGQGAHNCVIKRSKNRAIVDHGTGGLSFRNNVVFDVLGSAMFLEDGSEQGTTWENNVVLKVSQPSLSKIIKVHDKTFGDRGSSGFWITNMNNRFIGNVTADCVAAGHWHANASKCRGLSSNVPLKPAFIQSLEHRGAISFSNGAANLMTSGATTDELGNISGSAAYRPTTTGEPPGESGGTAPKVRFTISDVQTHHAGELGYSNMVGVAQYERWTSSDQPDVHFFGSASELSKIHAALIVGNTLNTTDGTVPLDPSETLHGMASYHHSLDVVDTTFVNFPFGGRETLSSAVSLYKGSGAMRTDDLYLIPMQPGLTRSTGLKFVNSHPGFRSQSPHIDGRVIAGGDFRNWTIAGAAIDAHGYWGNGAGVYMLQDHSFMTYGAANLTAVQPAGQNQGYTTTTRYFGFNPKCSDSEGASISVPWHRQFYSIIEVDNLNITTSAVEGTWLVADALLTNRFAFRHAALRSGGRYLWKFPQAGTLAVRAGWVVSSFIQAGDNVVLGVEWSGAVPAKAYFKSGKGTFSASYHLAVQSGQTLPYGAAAGTAYAGSSVASMALLDAGVTLPMYIFQDVAANKVWVKLNGAKVAYDVSAGGNITTDPTLDIALMQYQTLEILAA